MEANHVEDDLVRGGGLFTVYNGVLLLLGVCRHPVTLTTIIHLIKNIVSYRP